MRITPQKLLACLGTVAISTIAGPEALAQPTITNLGVFPGWTFSAAYGMSSDGSTVAGYCFGPGVSPRAFRWTSANLEQLPALPGALVAYGDAISADGQVMCGGGAVTSSPISAFRAVRWTSSGISNLGTLTGGGDSRAYAISLDGSVLAGDARGSTGGLRAFRWTQGTGMVNLGTLPGGTLSGLRGMNPAGTVFVGYSDGTEGFRAIRWTATGGMQSLGVVPGGTSSEAYGVSENGLVITGSYVTTGSTRAFRWTEASGMQDLGVVPGGSIARGYATNSDGSIIVGGGGVSPGSNDFKGFIWTAQTGMLNLNTYLPTIGFDLTGWDVGEVRAITPDGRSIAGTGRFNGQSRAYLISGLPCLTNCTPACDSIDFNDDGLFPDDADLVDFLSVFAGGSCSTGTCNDIDFNNDGLFPDDTDLIAFLTVLAGGNC